jgi:hypothetical protein
MKKWMYGSTCYLPSRGHTRELPTREQELSLEVNNDVGMLLVFIRIPDLYHLRKMQRIIACFSYMAENLCLT